MNILSHIGSVLKKILHIGEEAAVVAQPFITLAFPEIAPLYASAIGLALAAQASAAPVAGTGPQKLSQVVVSLLPQIQAFCKQNGIVMDQPAVEKWVSALVESMKLIPAPTVAPVPAIVAAK